MRVMDKILLKKAVAVVSIILLFINMLFLALKVYTPITFWVILAVIAIIAMSIIKLVK